MTARMHGPTPELPTRLAKFLRLLVARQMPPREVVEAFASGVVFAARADTALDAARTKMLGIVECEEPARYLAARDLWRVLPCSEADEDEQLQAALLHLARYRFFCFDRVDAPVTVDTVYLRVREGHIATPQFIWLRGRFIDARDGS